MIHWGIEYGDDLLRRAALDTDRGLVEGPGFSEIESV